MICVKHWDAEHEKYGSWCAACKREAELKALIEELLPQNRFRLSTGALSGPTYLSPTARADMAKLIRRAEEAAKP